MQIRVDQYCIMALVTIVSVAVHGCSRGGVKTTSYGNIHFRGKATCDSMSIRPGPPPNDIELVLSNGQRVASSVLTRESISNIFGEPTLAGDIDNGMTRYEEFGKHECVITFKNGEFAGLDIREGVKVINLTAGKSITLPATESEIRSVFGKPTAITYPALQQP